MVQAMIDIPKEANQILNIVKARYNLKTKSEAIAMIIKKHGDDILEPELRPEFVEEMREIEKEGHTGRIYTTIQELRDEIEGI